MQRARRERTSCRCFAHFATFAVDSLRDLRGCLSWLPSRLTARLEYLRQSTTKSGQHCFSLQHAVRCYDREASVASIHVTLDASRIDDPDQLYSRREPVTDLREQLTGRVVRREDLDDQLGGYLGVTARTH